MKRSINLSAKAPVRLPLLGLVAAAMAFAIPSTGLAVAGFGEGALPDSAASFDLFTPSSVDPELAARVAVKARDRGLRFTPAGAGPVRTDRTVTVAVRIDDETAQAMAIRPDVALTPGIGSGITRIQSSRFDLGKARGYQSFARPKATTARSGTMRTAAGIAMPESIRNLSMPDLAEFAPSRPDTADEPSRLQPRVELEDQRVAGRSPNTLDAMGSQTLDVGGSFRLSRNLDVTAGVRYSQERERLDPVANSVKDSQAVYVGTQIKF